MSDLVRKLPIQYTHPDGVDVNGGGGGGNSSPQNDYITHGELANITVKAYTNGPLIPLGDGIINFTRHDSNVVHIGNTSGDYFVEYNMYNCILDYNHLTANPKDIELHSYDSVTHFQPYSIHYHLYCKEKYFDRTIFKCNFVIDDNYLHIYAYELDYFTDNIFYPAYYMKSSNNNDYYYLPYRIKHLTNNHDDFTCLIVIGEDFQWVPQNNNHIIFVDHHGNEKTASNLYINDVAFNPSGYTPPKLLKGTYICKYFYNTDSFKIYSIDLSNLIVS